MFSPILPTASPIVWRSVRPSPASASSKRFRGGGVGDRSGGRDPAGDRCVRRPSPRAPGSRRRGRRNRSRSWSPRARAAVPDSSTRVAISPSPVARPALLAAAASPFLRRTFSASARSPFVSARALLHSIMPTPVFSRSSFTKLAEITITSPLCRFRQKAPARPKTAPRLPMSSCAAQSAVGSSVATASATSAPARAPAGARPRKAGFGP